MSDARVSTTPGNARHIRLNATAEDKLAALQEMLARTFPELPEVDQQWALGRMTKILDKVIDRCGHKDQVCSRFGKRRRYQDISTTTRRNPGYAMLFFTTEYEDLKDPTTGRFRITTRELMVADLPLYRALRQWCHHRGVVLTSLVTDARRQKRTALIGSPECAERS